MELTPCGVPHLLFLIYNNDIHKSTNKLNFCLFADDTILLLAQKNLKVLEEVLNSELRKVSELVIVNKLSINIKKSNYFIFYSSQKKFGKDCTCTW